MRTTSRDSLSFLFYVIRDLKIPGRDELERLPEVNLDNQACARELSTHLPAVLVSSRTAFHLICRRIWNVSIYACFGLANVIIDVIFSYNDENVCQVRIFRACSVEIR